MVRLLIALGFATSGALHFLTPGAFRAIVPAGIGDPALLVAISGAAELAGAVGILLPATRRAAAWGLVLLLAAVFPANVNMALHADRFAAVAPAWVWWARLPVQPLLIALVLYAGTRTGDARAARRT